MCIYCGSIHEKYDYCYKCHNEICKDCASPSTSRIFKEEKSKVHKAGHCWGHRYGQLYVLNKAEEAYQESIGTPTEEIARYIREEVQNWTTSDENQMVQQQIDNLILVLKTKIPDNNANRYIHNKIEDINRENDLVKKIELVSIIVALIPQIIIEGNIYSMDIDNVNISDETISQSKLVNTKLDSIIETQESIRDKLDRCFIAINKKGHRQEIVISTGAEIYGTGYKVVTTIPLQNIIHQDIEEDIGNIIGNIKFSKITNKLKNRIFSYIQRKGQCEK